MIRAKEMFYFLVASIVVGYLFAFKQLLTGNLSPWLNYSILAFIMIILNALACELAVLRFGCDAEYRLWGTQNIPWTVKKLLSHLREKERFKKEVPLWLIVPLVCIFVTLGLVKWLAVLVFEAVPVHLSRMKKGRLYAELTEWDLALIASLGPLVSVLLAVVSKIISGDLASGIFFDFAKMNIWYALFNLLPLSDFNGAKIFYGSKILWAFLFIFTLVILILLLGPTKIIATLIAAAIIGIIAVVLMFLLFERRRR